MRKSNARITIQVILLLVIVVFMSNCQQEFAPTQDNPIQQSFKLVPVSNYILDNIPIIENNQNIDKLLLNPDDKDDEKINIYLYELSLAVRELIKDANFNRIIISMAVNSENQTASLLELKNVAPEYFILINSKLSDKGLSISIISNDLTHKPVYFDSKSREEAVIEKYIPAIFIPNLEILDADKQPIISPNIEVDCDNDESLEDNIIAWYYSREGDLTEILLSEETSLKTSNPLFLLDNSSLGVRKSNSEILPPEGNLKGITTTTSFHSNEFNINYRHETTGNSEFCIVAFRVDQDSTLHWIYNSSGWKEIASVDKDDIGEDLSQWTLHCGNYTPYAQNYVFWNTFERDWSRSEKNLGKPTAYGDTVYMSGRMRYDTDWYAWTPSTVEIHATDLSYIYSNWAIWYSSWKSDIKIWRVEL